MITALAERVFGSANCRYLKRLEKTVSEINKLEPALEALDDTDDMVGITPSITIALFAPREFVAPGLASVNVAALPAASLIVPLFNANADVLE